MTGLAELPVEALSEQWRPKVRQPLSDWMERNLSLSSEYSSKTGLVRLLGWQKQICDADDDEYVSKVVLMSATQMFKSLFIQGSMARAAVEDPGPIMLLEPTIREARKFSQKRLAPMLRDCPSIARVFPKAKSRDSNNTIEEKSFTGGFISIVSATKPANVAGQSIRYLYGDEIDKNGVSAGKEGDALLLAEERLSTYGDRAKSVYACSPTDQNSRINREYEKSDQRKPFVTCPACGKEQLLKWANVQWDETLAPESQPGSAVYKCEDCPSLWDDVTRMELADAAVFKPTKPFAGIAGFWISHLYSPWKRLSEMVKKFLEVKHDPEQLKVFVNTTLAEIWESAGDRPDHIAVYARREDYAFGQDAVVPGRAIFLTAGVDVQEDRLEVETIAWGPHRESWSIDYSVLQALDDRRQPISVSREDVWTLLDAYLALQWPHESGGSLPILAMCIDTGYKPQPVYRFARRHPQARMAPSGIRVTDPRTVVCIRGGDGETMRAVKNISSLEATKRRGNQIRIIHLGTGYLKQQLYDLLKTPAPRPGQIPPYPGVQHFPAYSEDYFRGLTAEKKITHENGTVSYERLFKRNEAIDTRVYGMGAASLVGIERMTGVQWDALRERLLGPIEPIQSIPRPQSQKTEVDKTVSRSAIVSGAQVADLRSLLRPIKPADL